MVVNSDLHPTSADAASLNTLGTTASPLLAGFSTTLIGLVAGGSSNSTIKWPDITLIVLSAATILFIFSVQFTIAARKFNLTTEEHERRTRKLSSRQRNYAFGMATESFWRWSERARLSFNFGLGLLLLGLSGILLPPDPSSTRLIAIALILVSFFCEACWVTKEFIDSRKFRKSLSDKISNMR